MNALNRLTALFTGIKPNRRAPATDKEATASAPDNPYLAARQEWNLMFGDLLKAKLNWQRAAFGTMALSVLLAIGLIALSLQSRYVPYAVKVDALGNTAFAGVMQKAGAVSDAEINAFLRRYISNVRTVIADPVAQKAALNFVYATSTQKTAEVLNGFYRSNDPFKLAQNATVEVDVTAAMPKSDKTWQLDWTEVQRNADGAVMGRTHWEALLTVGQHSVEDAATLNINPLGLFVEGLSWSPQS